MLSGSPLFVFVENESEVNAQAQLNPAAAGSPVRRDEGLRDHAKGRRIGQVKCRIQEDRMIEGIEKIGRDFKTVLLVELRLLADSHVEIPDAEAAEWLASARATIGSELNGPEVVDGRTWVCEEVDARAGVSRTTVRAISGRTNAARAADVTVNAPVQGTGIHSWDSCLRDTEDDAAPQGASRQAFTDCKRLAAGNTNYACRIPAADDVIEPLVGRAS